MDLKAMLAKSPEGIRQLEKLEREAELGRRYLKDLRCEVARLGGIVQPELKRETLEAIADKLEEEELLAVKGAWEKQLEKTLPVKPQLTYRREENTGRSSDNAFLI